ncbi:cyclin-dependent kinase 2-interacting protein [Ooceraea biroi]|uniref:cyclin-dependent kinase 2-interacting protein n=1 Tax=Ooceraea biroi TaxID=2015173 RepID=UPI000F077237|nr:cyclin-dependent kinase 2-interacting protein [Ooceraea biroi]
MSDLFYVHGIDKMYSPIKLSPSKLSQGKNITGIARHVRDLTADIHANIQQWNGLNLQGIDYLKLIIHEKQDKGYSENLQDLCDKLENICNNLDDIVKKLDEIKHQLKTITALQETPTKLFMNVSTSTFGETAETIYEAYCEEAKIKRKVLENVAHHHTESMDIFHLAAWTHQPSISDRLTTLLEVLLLETGLRSCGSE